MKKSPQPIKAKITVNMPVKPDLENKKVRAIVDAARKLFMEEGLADPSVDLIADTAGVSKATIYAHFPSKEDLLVALIEHEVGSRVRGVFWKPGTELSEVEEDLRRIAQRLMAFFLDLKFADQAFHRLIEDTVTKFPKICRAAFEAGPGTNIGQVASYLSAADSKGFLRIPDVQLAARQFISLVHSDLPVRYRFSMPPPSEKEIEAIIEGAVRVFLAAYGTSSSGRRR